MADLRAVLTVLLVCTGILGSLLPVASVIPAAFAASAVAAEPAPQPSAGDESSRQAQGPEQGQTPQPLPQDLTPEQVREMMSRMSDQQVRALMLQAADEMASARAAGSQSAAARMIGPEMMDTARDRLRLMVLAVPDLPQIGLRLLERVTGDHGPSWGTLIWFVVLIFGGGLVAEWLFRRLFSRLSESSAEPDRPQKVLDRLCILLLRLLRDILAIAVFGVITAILFFAFWQGHEPTRIAIVTVFWAVVLIRLIAAAARFALAPAAPSMRLPPIGNEMARQQYRRLLLIAGAIVIAYFINVLVDRLGIAQDPGLDLALVATLSFIVLVIAVVVVWLNRRVVTSLLLSGSGRAQTTRLRQVLAANWHVFVTCACVVIWLMAVGKQIMTGASIAAPLTISLCVLLAIPMVDWILAAALSSLLGIPPAASRKGVGADTTASVRVPAVTEDAGREDAAPAGSSEDRALEARLAYRDVLMRNMRIVLGVVAVVLLTNVWSIDIRSMAGESTFETIFDIAITLILASAAWGILKTAIRYAVPREQGARGEGESEATEAGEAGGAGSTRLETLVPLLGKFLLVTLVVVALFVILSELGVDIGPLIAGAGVVGLAIGFGAQTLVKDILSGIFFLIDDAFRVGEYIDVGSVKGMVERISIRSLRLRHHLGPVHTIPFGEIRHLTNFSRDWAIMKLEMRVPFDTDLEKVRKLIKKVGQEMMADPEHGVNFLQPLKSQGVHRMDDSAFIIRVKFMAKPGEQFVLRREVFRRVQEAFADAGIQFAPRRVIVDAAGTAEGAAAAALASADQLGDQKPARPETTM